MNQGRVMVIQNAAPETTGAIGEALANQQVLTSTVLPFAGETVPRDLADAKGLVIMGGPMGVYEQARYPFLRDELNLIEQALRDTKPVLGVCLGSQLLATALGAEVKRGIHKEIGWYTVWLSEEAKDDPLWAGIAPQFTAFHWHGDWISLPSAAVSIARSEITACQAFRYERSAYGLLFHMEVTESLVQAMVGAFAQEVADASVDGASIVTAIPKFLPPLRELGLKVSCRWAALLGTC